MTDNTRAPTTHRNDENDADGFPLLTIMAAAVLLMVVALAVDLGRLRNAYDDAGPPRTTPAAALGLRSSQPVSQAPAETEKAAASFEAGGLPCLSSSARPSATTPRDHRPHVLRFSEEAALREGNPPRPHAG